MVIYKDLFWGTSRDPVGFKNFVDVDIMVVACPLQDCCCISRGDYDVVTTLLYTCNIVITIIFQNLGHIKLVTV
jgi:hypothetical protein